MFHTVVALHDLVLAWLCEEQQFVCIGVHMRHLFELSIVTPMNLDETSVALNPQGPFQCKTYFSRCTVLRAFEKKNRYETMHHVFFRFGWETNETMRHVFFSG